MTTTPQFARAVEKLIADVNPAEDAVAFCEELIARLPTYDAKAKELFEAATKLEAEAASAGPAAAVVDGINDLRKQSAFMVKVCEAILVLVDYLTPELKEEDNAGVAIQMQVQATAVSIMQMMVGSTKEKSAYCNINTLQDYLGVRADIEEKMNPSGKEAQPSKSASRAMQLVTIDAVQLRAVAQSFKALKRIGLSLVLTFARNEKKVMKPRREATEMIG
jgi:hypothetical protein